MTSETNDPDRTRKDPVASLAGQIRHLGNGERAELRRLDLTRSPTADGIIYGLLARAGVEFQDIRDDEMDAWRVTSFAAAMMSGSAGQGAHAPGRRMGRTLYHAGYSEARLMQLAGGSSRDRLMRAIRFLSKKADGPFDLRTVRSLADPDPQVRETAARELVRDYFSRPARTTTAQHDDTQEK